MKKAAPRAILRAVTNPLRHNYLVRCAWVVVVWAAAACGGKQETVPTPAPTAPLPTAGLAGQQVLLLPLTLVAAEEALHWDAIIADRRGTLAKGDSVIASLLPGRAPEVSWVLPAALRRAARRAAGVAADPD